jgi:hypothetical protein
VTDPPRPGDRLLDVQGRVVDQDIDPAEDRRRFLNQSRDRGRVTEIRGDDSVALAGQLAADRLGLVDRSPAVQHDPVAGGREHLGHRGSDAA